MSSCTVCLCVQCICPPPPKPIIKTVYYPGVLALILILFISVGVNFGNHAPVPLNSLSDTFPDGDRDPVTVSDCVVSCDPIAQTQSYSSNTVTVAANAVNVRSRPSLDAPVVEVLSRNAIAEVASGVAAPPDWIAIVLPDQTVGYVLKEYLR
jgi:Bacterial SH3 domain